MARRFRMPALVVGAAVCLVSGVGITAAAPAVSATGAKTATTHLQQAVLHGSTTAFPKSVTHPSGGAVNLTESGSLQRFAAISHSARPNVRKTATGNRVMTTATSWLPTVTPTSVSATRPGTVKGWQGLNEFSNQKYAGFSLEPPDQGLCAANGHVFELINDVVAVYSTSGTTQAIAYLNDFFKEPAYQFTTDPSCIYDKGSNRFFATELTLGVDPNTGALTNQSWLDLAVSKTGDPTGGWNIYRLDVTDDGTNGTPSHKDCPCIGDFPHLATDAHGVFLTTNEYPFSTAGGVYGNNFNGAQVYALGKNAVVAGAGSVNVVQFENTRIPTSSGPVLTGFTLWPAQSAGNGYATGGNGTEYFVSSLAAEEARPDSFSGHANQIGLWWLTNTASLNTTPAVSLQVKVLPVGNYGIPPLSNQKAGPVPLKDCLNVNCNPQLGADPYTPEQEGGVDSSDTRPLTAVYAGGTVYAALDTAMQVSGNVQAGFQWFAINAAQGGSSVASRGYVGVAHANAIYPAITTDKSGNGYVGMTLAGDNYYPSAVYAAWSNGPASTIHVAGAGQAPSDGFCAYLLFNCGGTSSPSIRPRWGDYGGAAWDGSQFYLANEYVAHSCTFATFNANYTCGDNRTFFGNFSTHIQVLR